MPSDDEFIEEIKSCPYLYDKKSNDYKNRQKKVKAWREIATKFKTSVTDCQRRWKNLRDSFSRALAKYRLESMNGNNGNDYDKCFSKKRWKHFETMLFLQDYVKVRNTKSLSYNAKPSKKTIFESPTSNEFSNSEDIDDFERVADKSDNNELKYLVEDEVNECDEFQYSLNDNRDDVPNYEDEEMEGFLKLLRAKIMKFPERERDSIRMSILTDVHNKYISYLKENQTTKNS